MMVALGVAEMAMYIWFFATSAYIEGRFKSTEADDGMAEQLFSDNTFLHQRLSHGIQQMADQPMAYIPTLKVHRPVHHCARLIRSHRILQHRCAGHPGFLDLQVL